jgi:hypothetical protein
LKLGIHFVIGPAFKEGAKNVFSQVHFAGVGFRHGQASVVGVYFCIEALGGAQLHSHRASFDVNREPGGDANALVEFLDLVLEGDAAKALDAATLTDVPELDHSCTVLCQHAQLVI